MDLEKATKFISEVGYFTLDSREDVLQCHTFQSAQTKRKGGAARVIGLLRASGAASAAADSAREAAQAKEELMRKRVKEASETGQVSCT